MLPITTHQFMLFVYYAIQAGHTPEECELILCRPGNFECIQKITFSENFGKTPPSGLTLYDHWLMVEYKSAVLALSWDPRGNPPETIRVPNTPEVLSFLSLVPTLNVQLTSDLTVPMKPTPFSSFPQLPMEAKSHYHTISPSHLLSFLRVSAPDMPNDTAFLDLVQSTFDIRVGLHFKKTGPFLEGGTPRDHTLQLVVWMDSPSKQKLTLKPNITPNYTFWLEAPTLLPHGPTKTVSALHHMRCPAAFLTQAYTVANCVKKYPYLQLFAMRYATGRPLPLDTDEEVLVQWMTNPQTCYYGPAGVLPSVLNRVDLHDLPDYVHPSSILPDCFAGPPHSPISSMWTTLDTSFEEIRLRMLTC